MHRQTRYFTFLFLILFLMISLQACSVENDEIISEPTKIRFSVVPDENRDELIKQYKPLMKYLSDETGIPFELIIPATYEELLDFFHAGKIDLAVFGGFTFAKANIVDKAIPLVMRDIDSRFTSFFLVRTNNKATSIEDFKGASFSFGSELSTSGHLMPRYFLREKGIIPESFFGKILYSGKHDKTAVYVRDGIVDIGVANSGIVRKMFLNGKLDKKEVRVLWETPPYVDYVWAVQPNFDVSIQIKIQDALLNLTRKNKEHVNILDGLNAGTFLPASINDFYRLQIIIDELNLL